MKRTKWILGLALMLGLTGCGAGGTESIDDYAKQSDQTEASSDSKNQTNDSTKDEDSSEETNQIEMTGGESGGIPSHLKGTFGKGSLAVNIDADVIATDYDKAKIYKMEEVNMDEEYLTHIADNLFDNGKYTVVLPYQYWDKDELQKEKEILDQKEEENPDCYYDYGRESAMDTALEQEEKKPAPEIVAGTSILRESTNDGLCNNVNCTHQFVKFRGLIDGVEHELNYIRCMNVYGESQSLTVTALEPVVQTFDIGDAGTGDNVVDAKIAEKKAKDLLDKIGFGEYTLSFGSDLTCIRGEEQEHFNGGYYMIFTHMFPELTSSMIENYGIALYGENAGEQTIKAQHQNNIMFRIYDGGAMQIEFDVNSEAGDVMSGETLELLSFDKVLEIAEGHIAAGKYKDDRNMYYDWMKNVLGNDSVIGDVRLAYLPVKYDNQYAYVPAWVFSYTNESFRALKGVPYMGFIAVGAVDGEVYNFIPASLEKFY